MSFLRRVMPIGALILASTGTLSASDDAGWILWVKQDYDAGLEGQTAWR